MGTGLRHRLFWFLVAGGTGFSVDAGVLKGLIWLGLDARPARLVSFSAALVTTWLINRSRTFGDRAGPPTLAEFGRYVAASLVAGLINLALFFLLVTFVPLFAEWPVAALLAATLVSMTVNFLSYNRVVFRGAQAVIPDGAAGPGSQ